MSTIGEKYQKSFCNILNISWEAGELSARDYHLFPGLMEPSWKTKIQQSRKYQKSDATLARQDSAFCGNIIDKMVLRLNKCFNRLGDYIDMDL
ncbi:hypothetical protein AVEN_185430-1 [Araneus ventricosus]|uniref:Uncharacterized protein n=1 Tax=Araneus ventricosus TaxID=182803 RepID=A0A4Y2CJJ9_ARAVE|nr:hypothetical protein AVEN_185430-1 [Araneus ventricosus]